MAYVIGSEKGKNIAKNLKTGEKYNCSDGSTWTKKPDGSVSVKTSSGQTFNNAYTPSNGGGSSITPKGSSSKTVISGDGDITIGGKTYQAGGSSGGGGSNKNSQYSVGGITYNENNDYTDLANEAYANGNPTLAAYYEQLHNYKIDQTGSNYEKTYGYQGYLLPDYGETAEQIMARGGDYRELYPYAEKRYNKAMTTIGLEQYANDELQKRMWEYIYRGMNNPLEQYEEWMEENPEPDEPENPYDAQHEALLYQILNRDDFSYNVADDPLYKQYAQMYAREGDRAMKETMAEAAASAGGMNSYAITAAQQARNNYSARLNDTIPQLYQLAYDMYLADKDSQVQNLGLLKDASDTVYNRYRDTMNEYKSDRNFWYNVMQADMAKDNFWTQFDYNKTTDDRDFNNNYYWTNKQWEYNTSKDQTDSAKEDVQYYIALGVMPPDDLLQKAGMDKASVQAAVNAVLAETGKVARLGGSSGGGSRSDGSSGSSGTSGSGWVGGTVEEQTPEATAEPANERTWKDGMTDLGLGLVYDPSLLVELSNAGAIYEANGKMHWTDGWNSQNFRTKLNEVKNSGALWGI